MSVDLAKNQGNTLVVDDEEHLRKLLSAVLQRAGYEVTLASDGLEALARVAEATPDLIITDVMMPNLDGFELLKRLRADPTTENIPVIMLTSKGATRDIVSGLNLGADDYLPKPLKMPILLARVRAKIERPPVPSAQLMRDQQSGLLADKLFTAQARREIQRAERGGGGGCLAYLRLAELEQLREQIGPRVEAEVAKQMARLITASARPLDLAGRDHGGYFALLLPETNAEAAQRYLQALAAQVMAHTFVVRDRRLRLTPIIGFTVFSKGKAFETVREEGLIAMEHAARQLDLVPQRYKSAMRMDRQPRPGLWRKLRQRCRVPFQFLLTMMLGVIMPYGVYAGFDYVGHDITHLMYIVVVIGLATTAFLIWLEGFIALKHLEPPDEPRGPYPPVSAIIAAYLPNEAATIVETVEAFLRLDYPAPLQVIVAYNTPMDLPIEAVLHELAEREPRLLPLRVEGSTSKAQNVNAALAEARGEFVGVFDADHHPHPRNFQRAWRWLSNGYDVVQGHCVVRNGDDSWVARIVAVEFEAIYAVSHPGRARLYDFGIFGGSNGYWKTDLLRETRLHSFMLTEDIDSSIRITEAGHKIASDAQLLSRELAPLNLRALWNQRMRWAQGWTQVSMRHFWRAMRSRKLSLRQKIGIFWLLGWREVYPWLSMQIFPLIAYLAVKYGGLDKLDWLIPIFVLTTLFTFSVGPGQTLFAYLLAVPEVRQHKRWFLYYLFYCVLFYTEFKNSIARIAQLKEWMGERQWKITPRAEASAPQPDDH